MSRNRYPGVYKRGTTWSYRAQFGDGEARRSVSGSGYASAKDANDARVKAMEAARPLAGITQRPDPALTLADFLAVWVPEHTSTLRPSTANTYASRAAMISKSPVAQRRLRSLKEADYRALVRDLRAQGNDGSVKAKVILLKVALDAAVRAGLIPSHPVRDIKITRTTERFRATAWEPEQAKRFLAHRKAAGDPLYPAWHLALVTGLRRGELHGLKREDVDLDNAVIHVRRQRTDVGGKGARVVEGPVKTEGSDALVHLDEGTVAILRDHTWTSDYLVTNPRTGRPYEYMSLFTKDFWKATENAGVPRIRFHDLRHTTASLLADLGVPLVLAQQRLRHMSPEMTARYTHALDSRGAEVAAAIGALVA